MSRPTGIGFRSPTERTPGFCNAIMTEKSMGLFSMSPTRQRYIRRFSRSGKGFGVTDRFLYEKLAKKMKACGDNLSPANYSHHIAFARMTATPCKALIKTLDIPKDELKHYRYVGDSLVYEPITLDQTQQVWATNPSKSLIKGTGGCLVHPSLRNSTQASTGRGFKNQSFYGSDRMSMTEGQVKQSFHLPTQSERFSVDNFNSPQTPTGEPAYNNGRNNGQFRTQTEGYSSRGGGRRNLDRFTRGQRTTAGLINTSTKSGELNHLLRESTGNVPGSRSKQRLRKLETYSSDEGENKQLRFSSKKSPPKSSTGQRIMAKAQDTTSEVLYGSGQKLREEGTNEKPVEAKKSQRSFNSYATGKQSQNSNASGVSRKSKRTNTLDMVVIGGCEDVRISKTAGSTRKPMPKNNTKQQQEIDLPEVTPSMILASSNK